MTIFADLIILFGKLKTFVLFLSKIFSFVKPIWNFSIWLVKKINIFKKTSHSESVNVSIDSAVEKVGFFAKVKNIMTPRAKLTYWIGDEEVIVYVDHFEQKDKFKLVFREIITGRKVMVNGSNPIIYRLEELKPSDKVEETVIQQNQKY